jgi:hypothetical protein
MLEVRTFGYPHVNGRNDDALVVRAQAAHIYLYQFGNVATPLANVGSDCIRHHITRPKRRAREWSDESSKAFPTSIMRWTRGANQSSKFLKQRRARKMRGMN